MFTGPEGGFLNLNYLREKNLYATLAGPKLRRRTFYQTCHTFVSNALADGENPKWVADMLGHKSTQILSDVYEKFTPRRTRHDGSALVARMREQSGQNNEPMSAQQYDQNTTVSQPAQPTGSVSRSLRNIWCRRRDCIEGVAQVLDGRGNPLSHSEDSFQGSSPPFVSLCWIP